MDDRGANEILRQVLEWLVAKQKAAETPEQAKPWHDLQIRVASGDPKARDQALTAMVDEENRPK